MTARHFTIPKITTILVIGLAVNVAAIQLTPWLQAHFAQRRLLIGLCGGLTIALLGSIQFSTQLANQRLSGDQRATSAIRAATVQLL
ncbi:hypothetical protein [Lactiplantibacillus pentosus]|nr:hypothetical protein [Lactiplantibacillus pentosus]